MKQTKLTDEEEFKHNQLDLLFSERKARYLLFRKQVNSYREDVKKIDTKIDLLYDSKNKK